MLRATAGFITGQRLPCILAHEKWGANLGTSQTSVALHYPTPIIAFWFVTQLTQGMSDYFAKFKFGEIGLFVVKLTAQFSLGKINVTHSAELQTS